MNNLELKTIGVQDLDTNEMVNVEGGIIPLIYGLYFGVASVMASGVTAGLYYGYHNNK